MSIKLDLHPVFGFDYEARFAVALKQNRTSEEDNEASERTAMILNISKVVGYIPVLNIIVGIARIIFAHKMKNEEKDNPADLHYYNTMILRGIEEIAFGPIMLINDIFFTIRDYRIVKQHHVSASV